jgi:hypothetical protein
MALVIGTTGNSTETAVFGGNDSPSPGGVGVNGVSQAGDGVRASSTDGNGISARSQTNVAIFARSESATRPAVFAECDAQPAVIGTSKTSDGVRASSTDGNGLSARSATGVGGFFQGGKLAAFFEGDIGCTGHINTPKGTITCNDVFLAAGSGDCAEEFDSADVELIEPGTVVVFDEVGAVRPSQAAYDRRVAGIVSGAGDFKPGIVLDRRGSGTNRLPIAILGKVYCKVDAQYSAIKVGDQLTTSPTAGHAMKASDPLNGFGAVIGKALRSIECGHGLIPVLVSLQ